MKEALNKIQINKELTILSGFMTSLFLCEILATFI